MMLTLGLPLVLLLLPLPWFVWRFAPPRREEASAIRIPFFRRVTAAAGTEGKEGSVVRQRNRLQMGAAIAIWVLVVLALARPERLGEPIVIESAARDIILAFDISGSMDERDFEAPDGTRRQRLEAVQGVMAEFIATRDVKRLVLLIFGTGAFVQAPFTEDLESLRGSLDQIVVRLAGSNIAMGDAIGFFSGRLRPAKLKDQVLILLSDGADTCSQMTPANAAAIAADRGVTIHTIGVGDPEASGEDKVDLAALQDIKATTGGACFFASDQNALEAVYAEIEALTPRIVETTSFCPRESLIHLPFAAALVTPMAASAILHFGRRGGRQHSVRS